MNETIEQPKKIKKQTLPKSLKEEEYIKLLEVIPNQDKISKTSFCLGYESGMRLSEIIGLKKEDIQGNRIFVEQGKYSKDRYVPMPKNWKGYMLDLLPLKVSGRTLQRNFKKYSKLAGLDSRYTFHSLRHGFAIKCLSKGMPINELQLFLGHSNVSTTNVYIKANPEEALKRYEQLF